MAERIYRAVVTDMQLKKRTSGPVEIYTHLLTENPNVKQKDRVLNTGIPLGRGEGCNIEIDDQVSVIINEGEPSSIEAVACRSCVFTKARGAKLPLVCRI